MIFNVVKCTTNTNVYERTSNIFVQNTFSSVTTSSKVACCSYCDQLSDCKTVNYKKTSRECKLSREPLVAVSVNGQTDADWNAYSKDEWMLVFRATPGVGGDVFTAWTDGTSVTTDDVTCMTTDVTSCSQHYRNPIVDSWTTIGMSQVKFAFYKNNIEKAYIIFNATGSDVTNWFIQTRITESSWSTIASDSFNYFSIEGHAPSRRFFINRNYGGCPYDTAYAAVIIFKGFVCSHDDQDSYPQFLYADSATFGYPDSMTGMDRADVMAIFIK
ncbi:uncharacterized protein LOC123542041 [Mercenaria mercenaria]|uniref:uncharacterized protein LOC123542041 n=1 Tax=Mercenaria mercenaria TaxID=6596 RepID=UPI00234F0090|nr:uncharacterized protein LOC123542041 [Mercenaria mercenaria]